VVRQGGSSSTRREHRTPRRDRGLRLARIASLQFDGLASLLSDEDVNQIERSFRQLIAELSAAKSPDSDLDPATVLTFEPWED
jgi:hypothetical protein